MNYKKILKLIKQHDTIIIHRHINPDYDAIGSQLGLKEVIKTNFSNKKVYAVGEVNDLASNYEIDEIPDSEYLNALVIVVDVAVKKLLSDDRAYKLTNDVLVIDHHTSETDIDNAISYIDYSFEATAAFLADIVLRLHLKVNPKAANYLMLGIVGDSGRFRYLKKSLRLFRLAYQLVMRGADLNQIYETIYIESYDSWKMKSDFLKRVNFDEGVAYLKNDEGVVNSYPYSPYEIGRKNVNLMAGIEGYPIWLSFTLDPIKNVILGEFRSRNIKIVDIAKRYNGGGHDHACGAILKSWDEVKLIIEDFKKLLKRGK